MNIAWPVPRDEQESALQRAVQAALDTMKEGVPIGTICFFRKVPTGWLHCGGGEFLVEAHPSLAAILQNTFGVPSVSGKCRLPNIPPPVTGLKAAIKT